MYSVLVNFEYDINSHCKVAIQITHNYVLDDIFQLKKLI